MSDEAVRKEFEAWFTGLYFTNDPIAKATIWAAWQASRSAAIQECAAVTDYYAKQMFGEKLDAEDLAVEIGLAIKALKER